MILVDANILLYAEDLSSPHHMAARTWWDAQLSKPSPICLCWPVIDAFIRLGTNARIFERPLSLRHATDRVQSWIDQPCVRVVTPTQRHWAVYRKLLTAGQAVAGLAADAHLAALAIEHGCEMMSTDADFSRFPGLKWRNPLQE